MYIAILGTYRCEHQYFAKFVFVSLLVQEKSLQWRNEQIKTLEKSHPGPEGVWKLPEYQTFKTRAEHVLRQIRAEEMTLVKLEANMETTRVIQSCPESY